MKKNVIALLSLALALQAAADVQLLPAGEFVGRDGRPGNGLTWKLNDAQGQALAARLTAKHAKVQFNLDYEHQAMLADKNGQPAPASGWATSFEWRAGVGLFALNVQWTANAKRMIEGGEYKYISPVIVFDKTTGEVRDVLNASLVNIPSLDLNPVAEERMAALNANFSDAQFLTTNPEPTDMNPLLKALLAALNLPATEATTEAQALGAVAALKASADKADGLTTEVATLKAAAGGNPDPTKFVALDKFTELNNEVAALKAAGVERTVDELITEARAAGKCSPVVEEVWRGIGKVDVAQLKALIDKTPANPALAGLSQTGGKQMEKRDPNAAATADELAMCKNMGLTLEQFRAVADAAA
ncbi:MAG: phage protease [Polaromonas sp.]